MHRYRSTGGSVVECSPATRAARVRFPASAIILHHRFCFTDTRARERLHCFVRRSRDGRLRERSLSLRVVADPITPPPLSTALHKVAVMSKTVTSCVAACKSNSTLHHHHRRRCFCISLQQATSLSMSTNRRLVC